MKRSWILVGAFVASVACAQSRDVAVSSTQDLATCAEDCSRATADPCYTGVCDEATRKCKVVPAVEGTACDDGLFCTVGETCKEGVCGNGKPNPCGATECLEGTCNEDEDRCFLTAREDDTPCAPAGDLCIVGAVCKSGECKGIRKDCAFAPEMDECHVGVCDPATGACEVVPGNDFAPCHEQGPCARNQTCFQGKCQGGESVNGWIFSTDKTACHMRVCNRADGSFTPKDIPIGQECAPSIDGSGHECLTGTCVTGGICERTAKVGAPCNSAADDCSVAACNLDGVCTPTAASDGALCDDHDECTMAETCHQGTCSGTLKSGVSVYFKDDFSGPFRWTPPSSGADAGGPSTSSWAARRAVSSEWQVAGRREPERDHTATLDGLMAGCSDCTGGSLMESPIIDTTAATGDVWLTLWRALVHSARDVNSTTAVIAVFDGANWVEVYGTPYGHSSNEWTWTPMVFDVTKYKNKNFRIRIGFAPPNPAGGFVPPGSFFVDDVMLSNRPCATGSATNGGGGGGGN